MNIYLAGKIAAHDWRHTIVPHLRGWEFMVGIDGEEIPRLESWPVWQNAIFGRYNYVGPYMLGCDHRCYHGPNNHGYGLENAGCGSFDRVPPDQIARYCLDAVRRADIVFAWIETDDCYGTLIELGAAVALGKRVLIAGPRFDEDMWFVYEVATQCCFAFPEARTALEHLLGVRSHYQEYLKSAHWAYTTEQAKQRAEYRCQICNRHRREVTLDTHHRTYARLGAERGEDLTVLCRKCHELYETNKQRIREQGR